MAKALKQHQRARAGPHKHSFRDRAVTEECLQMAEKIGWSGKGLTEIPRGAYLHDDVESGIPNAIWLKPSGLTPSVSAGEDWEDKTR